MVSRDWSLSHKRPGFDQAFHCLRKKGWGWGGGGWALAGRIFNFRHHKVPLRQITWGQGRVFWSRAAFMEWACIVLIRYYKTPLGFWRRTVGFVLFWRIPRIWCSCLENLVVKTRKNEIEVWILSIPRSFCALHGIQFCDNNPFCQLKPSALTIIWFFNYWFWTIIFCYSHVKEGKASQHDCNKKMSPSLKKLVLSTPV